MIKNYQFKADDNLILIRAVINYSKSQDIPLSTLKTAEIHLNGVIVAPCDWETIEINKGDVVDVYPRLDGAVIGIAGAIGSAISAFAATTIGGIIVSSAISIGVSYIVSSIMSYFTKDDEQTNVTAGKYYTLDGGNNQLRPYEHLPQVVGKYRTTPDYAITPFQSIENNVQYLTHLFVVSAGEVDVLDVRTDTTPISSVIDGDYEYYVYSGWKGEPFKWIGNSIISNQMNYKLNEGADFIYETTDETNEISIVFSFPSGLFVGISYLYPILQLNNLKVINTLTNESVIDINTTYDNTGVEAIVTRLGGVEYDIPQSYGAGYRHVLTLNKYNNGGDKDGQDIPSGRYRVVINQAVITIRSTRQASRNIYDVQLAKNGVYNKIIDGIFMVENYTAYADIYIIEVQARQDYEPITYTGQSLTLLELRAKASDRLSGALDTVNCLAQLKGIDSNGNYTTSSNIACLARRLLTDKNIILTAGDVPLNAESFLAFEQHCDRYGFTANGVETGGRTLGKVLGEMLEVAEGYISQSNGEYIVVYDNPDSDIVDVITPRNSSNMSMVQSKPIKAVDGLQILFQNKDKDYQQDQILVHDKDITPTNVEKKDELWATDYELAYKRGMLTLAKVMLRSKVISFSTDWRAIDYKLGQKLLVQHPSFFLGVGVQGQVCGYQYDSNGYVEAVILDQFYNIEVGKKYTLKDGTKYSQRFWDITARVNEETNILYFTVPILEAQAPEQFKMLSLGETERQGLEVLVKSITRNTDFTADVECIPSATGYYSVIDGDIPPYESALTFPSAFDRGKLNKPQLLNYVADETTATLDKFGNIVLNAVLSMNIQDKYGVFFDKYKVYYTESGSSESIQLETREKYAITLPALKQDAYYNVTIQAISTTGASSEILTSQIHVTGLLNPPAPVDELYLNGTNLEIKVNAKPIDFAGYEVKISTNYTDSYEQSILITNPLNLDGIVSLSSYVNTAKRVMVKVVDIVGLKSQMIAINVSLGDVVQRNLYETQSELANGWNGTISNGYIENDKLYSSLPIKTLWNGTDVQSLWNGTDVETIYSSKPLAVTYMYDITITPLLHGAYLRVSADVTSGSIRDVFYSRCVDVDGVKTYSTPVLLTDYRISEQDTDIRIFIYFENIENLVCNDITTMFDVEDKPNMIIQDVEVVGDNFLVSVPENYYKKIKNVNMSLQYDSSKPSFNNAYTAKVISKGTIVNGYVSDGITIACYDINGNTANGIVDILIQGY